MRTDNTKADCDHRPSHQELPDGKLYINGEWVDSLSGTTCEITNPTTEGRINTCADGQPEDASLAVEAAHEAFESGPWSSMHQEERAKIMFRIADLIEERGDDLALREAMDVGMPYHDFHDVIVPHCAGLFRFFGGQAMTGMNGSYRETYEENLKVLTRREALGVVVAITPFNFPFTLTCAKLAPALAAGNTFVHKPAPDTPMTALALAQICHDAGLPNGVYNLITSTSVDTADSLVKNEKVDKVAFTGSTAVGQTIIKNAADTLKHTTMELGGKAPNIIFDDANLEVALQAAFWGIFWNKGEVCVAGSRILVQKGIYDEFVERFATMAREAVLGDPLKSETQVGPIATRKEFDKVLDYIEIGKKEARLVAGGSSRQIDGKGLFIEPTVFADATPEMRISREEIFGPVVPVIPFTDEAEAVTLANDTKYGLASGIQTTDMAKALRMADKIKAGTVWLNTWHKYHPNAPFGGYKFSGYGREQGAEALDSYTQHKTIWGNFS